MSAPPTGWYVAWAGAVAAALALVAIGVYVAYR